MDRKLIVVAIVTLLLGFLFRLAITSNGNFLFGFDSARDMVAVREVVALKKLTLIGPNTAIEGVYTGPLWYYLLAIPFIVSQGDPYSVIVMQMILWAVGGFFLLKLLNRYGVVATFSAGLIWATSNYIVLSNLHIFNPDPIIYLTPLLIFLLAKYLETRQLLYSIATWFLAGLFFQFELNFALFVPVILMASILATKNLKLLKSKNFYLGLAAFLATFIPQLIFELRHNFLLIRSLSYYLGSSGGGSFNLVKRVGTLWDIFQNTLNATFFNSEILVEFLIFLFIVMTIYSVKTKLFLKDQVLVIATLIVAIPLLGYLLIPTQVNAWHLGGMMAAAVYLGGYYIGWLWNQKQLKFISVLMAGLIVFLSAVNVFNFISRDRFVKSQDPTNFANQLTAVDFVYQQAGGKNFKVYVFSPSILDYPYQYLFWWRGLKKYGYVPMDYSYLPNVPSYIPNKELLSKGNNPPPSNLVFLIVDKNNPKLEDLWKNSFTNLKFVNKQDLGPYFIETRSE